MDYVYVTKESGIIEKMEVVTLFNLSNSDYNYIIYKSLSGNDYYVGKYIGEDVSDLITDLNGKELEYAKGIFDALVGE